jgi:hypothetical protein
MLLRLFFLLLLLYFFLRSLYQRGWASTRQRLHLGWRAFLEEAKIQWPQAKLKASVLSPEASFLPAWLWPCLRFLGTLRFWIAALRSLYLHQFLALPLVAGTLQRSQVHFFPLAGLALVLLCALKALFLEAPLGLCGVHLFFGANVLLWLYRGYHRAEAKEKVLYLNLAFCYLYGLILLLFFYPSLYLLVGAYLPRRGIS